MDNYIHCFVLLKTFLLYNICSVMSETMNDYNIYLFTQICSKNRATCVTAHALSNDPVSEGSFGGPKEIPSFDNSNDRNKTISTMSEVAEEKWTD